MVIKVKNKSYGEGIVDVESWSNPKTFLVDVCLKNGDTMPEYKENLIYCRVEEY